MKVAPCTDDADDDDYDDDDDNDDDDDDGDDCVSTRDARVNVGAWIDVHARAMREVRVDRDWEDAFAKLGAGDSVEDLLFVVLYTLNHTQGGLLKGPDLGLQPFSFQSNKCCEPFF